MLGLNNVHRRGNTDRRMVRQAEINITSNFVCGGGGVWYNYYQTGNVISIKLVISCKI